MVLETEFKLLDVWNAPWITGDVSHEERQRILNDASKLSETTFEAGCCTQQTPMPFHEEMLVAFVWFLFFSIVLYGPFIIVGLLFWRPDIAFSLIALSLAISRIPCSFSPSVCCSHIATLNLKYFNYRAIWKETLEPTRRFICVTPPHGLFPIGGILGIFAMPRFTGLFGHGIAATAVLNVPVLGNLLKLLGCIDASKESCVNTLEKGGSIGISSGGIAEIFETNCEEGVETIILKSRGGICKLALEHGVDIVPGI